MKRALKFSPPQLLLIGFSVVILVGGVLLLLPFSNTKGISFIDALYTSTSATCVTGLIVRDTPVDFTNFGKIAILILIQIGGLGYMSIATFLALLAGRKIGMSGQILLKESLNLVNIEGIIKFLKRVIAFVFIAEVLGALILSIRFMSEFPASDAIFKGIFHAVSAFNNAGFSLFSTNLMNYRGDITVNLTIMCLVVIGGLGFVVADDIYGRVRKRRVRFLSHSLIVLATTALLIFVGAGLIYLSERNYLFARKNFGVLDTVLSSLFASVTPRTAGYNTVEYSLLQPTTLFLTMVLMFIGASPGGTGGGVKTSTFSVVVAHIISTIRGKTDTVLFKRRIPVGLISKALVIIVLSLIFISAITAIIIAKERTEFQKTMFEVISAFGTVGLSTGNGGVLSLSANFSDFSKIMIIITMLAGRLGPLTLFTALLMKQDERIHYPEGRILIG